MPHPILTGSPVRRPCHNEGNREVVCPPVIKCVLSHYWREAACCSIQSLANGEAETRTLRPLRLQRGLGGRRLSPVAAIPAVFRHRVRIATLRSSSPDRTPINSRKCSGRFSFP